MIRFYVSLSFAGALAACANPSCPPGEIKIADTCYEVRDGAASDSPDKPDAQRENSDGGAPSSEMDARIAPVDGPPSRVADGGPMDASSGLSPSPAVGPRIRRIAAGASHTCAIGMSGKVSCWGLDITHQCANTSDAGTSQCLRPVSVVGDGFDAPAELTAGAYRICARSARGSAACWPGMSETVDYYPASGAKTINGVVDPIAIAAGAFHLCVVQQSGQILCQGYNQLNVFLGETRGGQLGDGSWSNRASPTAVLDVVTAKAVSAGWAHTCAQLVTGEARCWGVNGNGAVGDGTFVATNKPVPVVDLRGVVDMSAGFLHTCAVLEDRSARCWGYTGNIAGDSAGALGDGTAITRERATTVLGVRDAVQIASGNGFSCALIANGTVNCWGAGKAGQLGDGRTEDRLTATTVFGIYDAAEVAVGSSHACVLLRSGKVQCWGSNESGQLGDGTTRNSATPVDVLPLP